jgi:tetratricopeptide (TPR) repeat protein
VKNLYDELYLVSDSNLSDIQRILTKQRADWTARSVALPDEAARMLALIDEADAAFASDESRAAYDAELARSNAPTVEPDRDAERKADYEKFCRVAREYFDSAEYDLAELAINNALRNAPAKGADLELCLLASNTFYLLGKYDQSLNYQNQAIVLDPDDAALYVRKYEIAFDLGKSAPDDRRGTTEALVNILKVAIKKAEQSNEQQSLAQACSYLAWLFFTRMRNPQTTEEARQLATRAVAIDSDLEGARYVLDVLERERIAEEAERAEQARIAAIKKSFEDAGFKVLHLDEANRRALVITKDCIAKMPYHQPGGAITWEGCTLRRWLNNEYYHSLPQHIRARVIEVINQNPNNPNYGTAGGNATRDRVFLLRIDEAKRYFSGNSDRIAKYQGARMWWWLRSPGYCADYAANVHTGSLVDVIGNYVGNGGGVRSALWLNLMS